MLTLVTGENQNPGRVVRYVASVHDNGVFPGNRAVKHVPDAAPTGQVDANDELASTNSGPRETLHRRS